MKNLRCTLALWEAANRGFSVDRRYWQMLEDRFLDMQLADGGWNYAGDGPATGSMTTAGLAALFVTEDLLHGGDAADVNAGPNARYQQAIERGLQWMQRNFSPRGPVVASANSRVWSCKSSPIGKFGWIVGTTRETWVMSLEPIASPGEWGVSGRSSTASWSR